MKTKIWGGGLLLIVLIALGSFLDSVIEPRFERDQIEMFRKNIMAQLPMGTPKEQVVDYLKGNHYDFSIDKKGTQIEAVDHGISRSPFILQDYRVILDLDKTGRMSGVRIVEASADR